MKSLFRAWLARPNPERPLCVALFGPPGAGKSFAVEEILAESSGSAKVPLATLNLTQLPDVAALARALAAAVDHLGCHGIPVVFFDEFDAPRDARDLGWLAWLLAPMQDGEWLVDGRRKVLKRAIYVFAGGTASTFQAFAGRQDPAFVQAKGPDFVSRLAGYFDVVGPNANPHRLLRRATVLRHQLGKYDVTWEGPRPHQRKVLSETLTRRMLRVGRYRHGARSIGAVLAANTARACDPVIDVHHLPAAEVLAGHVDQGPLDPARIGGLVQFSGGGGRGDPPAPEALWKGLAAGLLERGAEIAYGGLWQGPDEPRWNFTMLLRETIQDDQLGLRDQDRKGDAAVRLFVFAPLLYKGGKWKEPGEPAGQVAVRGEVVSTTAQGRALLEDLSRPVPWRGGTLAPELLERLVNAILLYRMRLQVVRRSTALVAMFGKRFGWSGRCPGLVEEVGLALAHGRPVYLVGTPDFVSHDIGQVLGLGRRWLGWPAALAPIRPVEDPTAGDDDAWDAFRRELGQWSGRLRAPGPASELPIDPCELPKCLGRYAVDGPHWPDNGLDVEQNRRLFEATDPEVALDLITCGLSRRFGAT